MKVVVIGAGIAGLSIGWRLLQAGAQVVVLERAQPAMGATWAAAGMISVIGETGDIHPAERTFARDSAALWPEFANEVEDLSGRRIGYRRDGKLIVAADDGEQGHLAILAERETGLAMLSRAEARALEPLLRDDIAGALWDPGEARVDNRVLGTALVEIYLRAGGTLLPNETVIRIETDGRRIVGVRTPFALHEADAYVLSAGAWTGRIEGLPISLVPPVIPVKGEMIALTGGVVPARIVWGAGVYMVARGGKLLIGATASEDGFDTSLTPEARKRLLAGAIALMPELETWDVTDHWAGLRPGSPDGLPILGGSRLPGLWIATGQYRNGILFAPAIADVVSALVTGRSSSIEIAAFDPARFSGAALAKPGSLG